VIRTWGSTEIERRATYPCDAVIPHPDDVMWRAIDVEAPAEVTWRWLCQLKVAPYSYDLLDNLGRRSPRTLTPGADDLEVGQRMVAIFRLASFEPGRSLTIESNGRLFGHVAITYVAQPVSGTGSRIVVKLLVRWRGWSPLRWVLPAGDLVMMRKQLLTFKELAERAAV
jgi:hypothetical protein